MKMPTKSLQFSMIVASGQKGEGRCSAYLQIQDRRDRKLNVHNKCPKGLICIAKLHCVRTC